MGKMGMMGKRGMMGKMGMMGKGKMGMMGMGGMHGFDYHFGDLASNSCPTLDVSEADCLDAVKELLPTSCPCAGQVLAGSYAYAPPGCSVQRHFIDGQYGDWVAHYNRNPAGSNDGWYTPVCQEISEPEPYLPYLPEPEPYLPEPVTAAPTPVPDCECGHCGGFPSPAVIRNSHSDRRLYAREGHSGEDEVGADAGNTVHAVQKWFIADAGDGAYTITNYHSDRRLFAQDDKDWQDGVGAMSTGTVWPDQKWYIELDADCKYGIRNYHSGRRLFAQENKIWNDGVGAMASGNFWADQKWFIEEA